MQPPFWEPAGTYHILVFLNHSCLLLKGCCLLHHHLPQPLHLKQEQVTLLQTLTLHSKTFLYSQTLILFKAWRFLSVSLTLDPIMQYQLLGWLNMVKWNLLLWFRSISLRIFLIMLFCVCPWSNYVNNWYCIPFFSLFEETMIILVVQSLYIIFIHGVRLQFGL